MSAPLNLSQIKVIIGLGNPGRAYYHNRHNIGFRVVEALAHAHHGSFKTVGEMELAEITVNNKLYYLTLPQTFMNASGKVLPFFTKKGIKAEHLLVVHDELELPFEKMKFKFGGSSKGHNGLKSIINTIGPDFYRLAIGIGRPVNRDDVPDYVLENFKDANAAQKIIDQAVADIELAVLKS